MKLLSELLLLCCLMLSACNPAGKLNSTNNGRSKIIPADSIIKKQSSGVDFIAHGSLPVEWTLEMDLDQEFKFTASDKATLNAPAVKPVRNVDSEGYLAISGTQQMTIIVYDKTCEGKATAIQESKMVEITVNNTRYTGCGKYLYDHRMNGSWILEYIDNTRISPDDYPKEMPGIEFNILKNNITGFDGCKKIGSAINIEGSRIRFAMFTSKSVSCKNKVEKIFSEMLSDRLVDYYMKDGKLVLYLIDDSKLTFKRKE